MSRIAFPPCGGSQWPVPSWCLFLQGGRWISSIRTFFVTYLLSRLCPVLSFLDLPGAPLVAAGPLCRLCVGPRNVNLKETLGCLSRLRSFSPVALLWLRPRRQVALCFLRLAEHANAGWAMTCRGTCTVTLGVMLHLFLVFGILAAFSPFGHRSALRFSSHRRVDLCSAIFSPSCSFFLLRGPEPRSGLGKIRAFSSRSVEWRPFFSSSRFCHRVSAS